MQCFILIVVVVCVVLHTADAFAPRQITRKVTKLQVSLPPGQATTRKSGNVFEDFLESLLGVFPSVLAPSSWQSDKIRQHKLVDNPQPYRSPRGISGWKKSNKKRAYHQMSITEEFFAKWGIDVHAEEKQKKQILEDLKELSNSLKVPMQNIYAVEGDAVGYTGDGLKTAFSPMKTNLDQEHVVKQPRRLYSGVKLSNLKKVLRDDPDYFQH